VSSEQFTCTGYRILGFILLYFFAYFALSGQANVRIRKDSLGVEYSESVASAIVFPLPSRQHMPPFGSIISNYNDYPCGSYVEDVCAWVDCWIGGLVGQLKYTHTFLLANYLIVCKFADALRRCSVSILRLRKINFATPPFGQPGKRCVCVMDLCN